VAALTALANCLDQANGQPVEVVLDLATAVGKTYIAAGLIDYVAELGVRNIVVITPSRAILTKTVNNFTRGHPKSIKGRRTSPLVITGDDFQRGEVGTALGDDSVVKLFVFTVQQLIRPKRKRPAGYATSKRALGKASTTFYDRSATSWSSQTSTTRTTDRRSQTPSASSTRRPSSVSPRPRTPERSRTRSSSITRWARRSPTAS